jgi:hypothetical protein
MKEQDPLEKIQFYTKDEPNKGIQFERKQVCTQFNHSYSYAASTED